MTDRDQCMIAHLSAACTIHRYNKTNLQSQLQFRNQLLHNRFTASVTIVMYNPCVNRRRNEWLQQGWRWVVQLITGECFTSLTKAYTNISNSYKWRQSFFILPFFVCLPAPGVPNIMLLWHGTRKSQITSEVCYCSPVLQKPPAMTDWIVK